MTNPVVSYLVFAIVPLVLKMALYMPIFRRRQHRVSLLTCIILAGAPMLGAVVPIPLPAALMVFIGIGIALYVLAHYTEVPLFPEGVVIVVAVESISRLTMYAVVTLQQ